jgi:predicted unusual protein kinase regulating ubiquinone biosynthesis (AarF/ABC1/UbiB family)
MVAYSARQDARSQRGNDLVLAYGPSAELAPILAAGPRKTNVIREYFAAENGEDTKPGRWRIGWRLCQFTFYLAVWYAATCIDRLVPKWRAQARIRGADRLRRYIEKMGGTLIKLGQQASLRSDLLSEEYCDALASLFDRTPAFPVGEAYRAVEKQTRRRWQDTFAVFDPIPVGSASIACVYRAVLHNGDEVAVKVRRPGIRKALETDLAALAVFCEFLQFFTFVPPGLLDSFVSELRTMLLDETDFRGEVRHQELFRHYLARRKKLNVTAPRIYYALCGYEVIVSEFVHGFPMTDLTAAIHAGDHEYLARLRCLGIDPHRIAKRLIRSQYYQFHECPFFHGDPHPGNIFIRPGGQIVMVDFGACGVFSARDRNLMLQMNYHYWLGDVTGMVHCVLGLMEPIPAIDVDAFSKYLQDQWWKGYYGIKSHHADWSERTSFRLWVALLRGFRKFSIPMPLHMIRMVRATLLYDTVAAQLDAKINVFKEFEKYYSGVARRARIDIQEAVIRQLLIGPDDSVYVKIKRVMEVGNKLLFLAEKFLAEPTIGFEAALHKVFMLIDAVAQMIKTAMALFMGAAVAGFVLVMVRQALAFFGLTEWTQFDWGALYAISPWYPGEQDRTLQTVAVFWIFLVGLTMWSHACRTLSRFRRKDDYPSQHRVG